MHRLEDHAPTLVALAALCLPFIAPSDNRVYISGPMTGIADHNYPAFEAACVVLRQHGYEPVSPHAAPPLKSWEAYMRYDLTLLLGCNAIAMLSGWEGSAGATLEHLLAVRLHLKILHVRDGALCDDSSP